MQRGLLTGVAVLRWVAWIWVAAVGLANLHRVDHPVVAVLAIVVMGVVTAAAQLAVTRRSAVDRRPVVVEVAAAIVVVAVDGWVRQGPITGQSLAGTWPLAAILTSGIVAGPWWGALSGLALSAARVVAASAGGVVHGQVGRTAVATASTALFWVAIGAVSGGLVRILRRSQEQVAEAAVRERMARDLHDGVLQTLALIERRSPSPEIARLARDQERELRAYLFDARGQPDGLTAGLRIVALRAERTWPDLHIMLTLADDLPELGVEQADAVRGAVAEAITNAAKHGRATHVVVFGDADAADAGGMFVTIKDDGSGFDPQSTVEGVGMAQSIRARIEKLGGTVFFSARPGDGCDVRLTIPSSLDAGRRDHRHRDG